MADQHTTPSELTPVLSINPNDIIMTTNANGETKVAPAVAVIPSAATCSTGASGTTKTIKLTGYTGTSLPERFEIDVTFTNGNSYGDTTAASPTYPLIQFTDGSDNNLGSPIALCDSRGHVAGAGCYNAGDVITLRVNMTLAKARIMNSDVRQANSTSIIMADGKTIYTEHNTVSHSNFKFLKQGKRVSVSTVGYGNLNFTLEPEYRPQENVYIFAYGNNGNVGLLNVSTTGTISTFGGFSASGYIINSVWETT